MRLFRPLLCIVIVGVCTTTVNAQSKYSSDEHGPASDVNPRPIEKSTTSNSNLTLKLAEGQLLIHVKKDLVRTETLSNEFDLSKLIGEVKSANEFSVICDQVNQSSVINRKTGAAATTWEFNGNVRICTSKVFVHCHEATVRSESGSLEISVKGGGDITSELESLMLSDPNKTSNQGSAVIFSGTNPDTSRRYDVVSANSAWYIRQKISGNTISISPNIPNDAPIYRSPPGTYTSRGNDSPRQDSVFIDDAR